MVIITKKLQIKIFSIIFVISLFYQSALYAEEALVLNVSDNEEQSSLSVTPRSFEQRLRDIENKLAFLGQANLVEDMQMVRKKLQELQGTFELQKHQLEKLEIQQKNFYSDIDRRLSQLNPSLNKDKLYPATTPEKALSPKTTIKTNDTINSSSQSDQTSSLDLHGQKAYEDAHHLISLRRYQDALIAFNKFINDYPKSQYVANAHYWLGELYVQKGERQIALNHFEIIKNRYATNNKAADAKYKIGLLNKVGGNIAVARREFLDLTQHYSGTSAAQLAALQLRNML